MTTQEHLESFGFTMQIARDLILSLYESNLELVYDTCKIFGVNNDMIADILQDDLPNLTGEVVANYFNSHNLDGSALGFNQDQNTPQIEGVQITAYESENNDSYLTSNIVTLNTTFQGNLSLTDDIDWFTFDLLGPANVTVTYKGNINDTWYSSASSTTSGWSGIYTIDAAGFLLDDEINSINNFAFDNWNIQNASFFTNEGGTHYLAIGFDSSRIAVNEEIFGLSSPDNYEVNIFAEYTSDVFGSDSDDVIYGSDANQTLEGNEGNDLIVGGLGGDTLSGGPGQDKFIYLDIAESRTNSIERDTIIDFTRGEDVIDLSQSYWNKGILNNGNPVRFSEINEQPPEDLYSASNYAWFNDGIFTFIGNGYNQDILQIELVGIESLSMSDFII